MQTKAVSQGTGTLVFNVETIPKDWGSQGQFSVYVNLSEYPHPQSWTPLASDQKEIALAAEGSPMSVSAAYLQYRTYSPGAGENQFKGWIEFLVNDDPLALDSVDLISLVNDKGYPIPVRDTRFWYNTYFSGSWNKNTGQVAYSGPSSYGGYSVSFAPDTSLESGAYTYTAATDDGQNLTYSLYYPGKMALPTVEKESIHYRWNNDGTLSLAWKIPEGAFDEFRLVFMDGNTYQDLLYVKLPNTEQSLTIPAETIDKMKALYNSAEMELQVQTRNYTAEGNNYSRGITPVRISLYPSADPLTADLSAGTTSGKVPVDIEFSASATGGTPPYMFNWNFGDGSGDTGDMESNSIAHTYETGGSYRAGVIVTDADGNNAKAAIDIFAIALSSIEIFPEETLLTQPGAEKQLLIKGIMNNGDVVTPEAILWRSSDTDVAVIQNNRIKAVGEGEAVITAEAGDITATTRVKVSFEPLIKETKFYHITSPSAYPDSEIQPFAVGSVQENGVNFTLSCDFPNYVDENNTPVPCNYYLAAYIDAWNVFLCFDEHGNLYDYIIPCTANSTDAVYRELLSFDYCSPESPLNVSMYLLVVESRFDMYQNLIFDPADAPYELWSFDFNFKKCD
ncbi:MAG: PKD domain-containing protein [Desulfobacteraceae bacterium]